MTDTLSYRGRFAPSPSGPLHLGSLLAAVCSYCQARAAGGQWWLRIEDIDPPREQPGAAAAICQTLDEFGLHWDGPVQYQSQCTEQYADALQQLSDSGLLYACACSRKEIQAQSPAGHYPGTCRQGIPAGKSPRSWRLRSASGQISFTDAIQGPQQYDVETQLGDFVLRRADGLYAYQLATAVDDAQQGMTQVVRGADLLESTPRQRYVQQLLGLTQPEYAHHPVILNSSGEKLSKQNLAPALDRTQHRAQLHWVLRLLGQTPLPPLAEIAHSQELLAWAVRHWDLTKIPAKPAIQTEDFAPAADIELNG